jgi:DNA-binding response OmpR family regulator
MAIQRVLYVEDDTSLHDIVAAVLAIEGYEVTSVSSAEQGLRELAKREHGLLLTDYHLPDAAACWMIERARDQGLLWGVPVIVVTAERGQVESHGAPVLRKPIQFDHLLTVLRDALEQRGRARSGVRLIHSDSDEATREAS